MSIQEILNQKIRALGSSVTEVEHQLETMRKIVESAGRTVQLEGELYVAGSSLFVHNGKCVVGILMRNMSQCFTLHNLRLIVPHLVNDNCHVYLRMTSGGALSKLESWHPISEMPPNTDGYALILLDMADIKMNAIFDPVVKYNIKGDELKNYHKIGSNYLFNPMGMKKDCYKPFHLLSAGNPTGCDTEEKLALSLLAVWLTSRYDKLTVKIPRDHEGCKQKRDVLKEIMKTQLDFEKTSSVGSLDMLVHQGRNHLQLSGIMLSAARQVKGSEVNYYLHVFYNDGPQIAQLMDALRAKLPEKSTVCVMPSPPPKVVQTNTDSTLPRTCNEFAQGIDDFMLVPRVL